MRRCALAILLMLAGAALVAPAASAKEANVQLSSTPAGLHPGDHWKPTITALLANDQPSIGPAPTLTIADVETGASSDFQAMPTAEPGKYTVDVVFPHGGLWSLKVHDPVTGRTYHFPTAYIARIPAPLQPAAPSAPKQVAGPAVARDSFPLWPVLGGGLGTLALLALAALVSRPARRRPSAPARI